MAFRTFDACEDQKFVFGCQKTPYLILFQAKARSKRCKYEHELCRFRSVHLLLLLGQYRYQKYPPTQVDRMKGHFHQTLAASQARHRPPAASGEAR